MPKDEFTTDLQWPTDPLGERQEPLASDDGAPAAPRGLAREVITQELDRMGDRMVEVLQALRTDLDADLADLREEVAGLRHAVEAPREGQPLPSLVPVLDEIAKVREELTSLKRRIGLRATAEADAAVLSDEQLDRIARTVAGLLSPGTERPR